MYKKILLMLLFSSPLSAMNRSIDLGYVEASKRFLLKYLKFLDADLAGIGDEAERKKTVVIIKEYMRQLGTGSIDSKIKKQADERIPKILDACEQLTISCNVFNGQVDSDTHINVQDDLPEIQLALAKIALLEQLSCAIPKQMLEIMQTSKDRTVANVARLTALQKQKRESTDKQPPKPDGESQQDPH